MEVIYSSEMSGSHTEYSTIDGKIYNYRYENLQSQTYELSIVQ
jgi:hypothetical protein